MTKLLHVHCGGEALEFINHDIESVLKRRIRVTHLFVSHAPYYNDIRELKPFQEWGHKTAERIVKARDSQVQVVLMSRFLAQGLYEHKQDKEQQPCLTIPNLVLYEHDSRFLTILDQLFNWSNAEAIAVYSRKESNPYADLGNLVNLYLERVKSEPESSLQYNPAIFRFDQESGLYLKKGEQAKRQELSKEISNQGGTHIFVYTHSDRDQQTFRILKNASLGSETVHVYQESDLDALLSCLAGRPNEQGVLVTSLFSARESDLVKKLPDYHAYQVAIYPSEDLSKGRRSRKSIFDITGADFSIGDCQSV